jgi:hypothetical protein
MKDETKVLSAKVPITLKDVDQVYNSNSKPANKNQTNLVMEWSGPRDSGNSFSSPIPASQINRYSWVPARNETPKIPELPRGNSWYNSAPSNPRRRYEAL